MSSPRRTRSNTPSHNGSERDGAPGTPGRRAATPARQPGTPATPGRRAATPARQPGTPARQSGTPGREPGTPQNQPVTRTPSSSTRRGQPAGSRTLAHDQTSPNRRSSRSTTPASTPLGFGSLMPAYQHAIVEASDPLSIAPSSPIQNLAPTSPFGAGMSEIDLSSPLNYGTPSSINSLRTPRSGIRGTPIRLRPDIRTDRRIRQVNMASESGDIPPEVVPPSEGESASQESASQGPNLVIWGTDVVVSRCKDRFKRFVKNFMEAETDMDEQPEHRDSNEPLYIQKMEEIHMLEEPFLNVNCAHLEAFDPELYRQLVCYPQEVIPTLDMAINEMFFDHHPAAILEHQIQVRPFNAQKTKNMRSLNPEDIDQLISVSGMVTRSSNIMPEMREAFFKCMVCALTTSVEIDRGRIAEPTLCSNCNTNHCFTLVHNRSQFTDKQIVKLQESPDDMPAGQTPHTVVLFAHNDLVDAVLPGDRITVTGIYRAIPIQVNPRMRNVRAVYRTHVDVVHFRKTDDKRLYENHDGKDHRFPPERVEMLQELSKKDDIYERLARAIAPSIYENEDIKKGILLQMFGGTKKTFTNSGRSNFRAEINILLCGDPGTSKSQLLSYVYNLVPRSQYTSGKGSSAVGLTAYVSKDPETRQLVLQTGALVLADNGICCIDEFDKMNDSTRSILHEVMEQQTLSIAKAGIICQLNARTSILAAANPCESQWNKNKTIIENIQLPHTLMSRFDLIFLMLDPQNEQFDRRLARHLVSMYYKTRDEENDEFMDMGLLRDYIAYAREHIHPRLSEEASQRLIQCYVDMRKVGSGQGQISAYPRQLESLIRLAEAHTKMRFSETVNVEDVEEAYRLHREALKQSATDPLSGKIDVGILTTGLSSAARKRRQDLTDALRKMLTAKGKGTSLSFQKVLADMKETSQTMITREMFEDSLKELQDEGTVALPSRTTIKIC